jgi:quinol monooxygenase YgiN
MSSEILTTIGRFHAKEGSEGALEAAIKEAWPPAAAEAGNVSIQWYRSIRDPRLFFVYSRWADESAFNLHADLPHTETLLEKAEQLVDQPIEVSRLREVAL